MTPDEVDAYLRKLVAVHPLTRKFSWWSTGDGASVQQGLSLESVGYSRADDALVAEIEIGTLSETRSGRLVLPADVTRAQLARGLTDIVAATQRVQPGATAVVQCR